jgi:hypothetical protein
MDWYGVFLYGFSILFFYFSKLYLLILFFKYWADWEFIFVIFFFKTLLIAIVFLYMIFFVFVFLFIFFQNYLCRFYFLILSWLRITVTICGKSTVAFLANYCGLLHCFFPHGFFLFFSKIVFVNFIF